MANKMIDQKELFEEIAKMWRYIQYAADQQRASGLFIADQMQWERPEFDDQ